MGRKRSWININNYEQRADVIFDDVSKTFAPDSLVASSVLTGSDE